MRKLAMLLASILTLNLVAPAANVYAAPADSMTEMVADEATIFEEGDVSGNNSTTSGNDSSASGNNPTDPGNDPSVSNNDPSVSENEPSVSNNDPSVSNNDPSVSNNDPSVSNNDPSVSNNDPSVSENEIKDLFVTEKYYKTQKGYPLVGIIKVPYLINALDWPNYVFNFKELNVSVDDGEAKEVQVTKSNQYTYGHNSENMTDDGFYVLFNAGYDDTIIEGTHKLTYTGIVSDGRKDFEFEVSAEAEFTDGDVSYPRSDRRNKQFMSAYKDSLVKMIYSGFDLEDYDEKITEVKLRNSETKQEYATELLYKYDYNKNSSTGGRYKGFVGLPEGNYLSIFNEDYYGYGFHCSIKLKEEVPEGDYDLVFITSEGNRNIVEDYYKATKKPVVLGLYPNSIKEKSGTVDFYKTGLPIYTDNSGDYVSVFVYGLNLTKDNIPVFYNEDRTATVTEYTETEEQCGYEAWEYGFDFTVKKTGDVNVSGNEVSIPATVTGDVIYADGWSSDVIDESEVALSYYQSLIDRSEYNISAQTLRFYLTPGFVEENDVIHISTSRYSDGENYDANVVCDGREYYIEIDKATALYQNYTTYNTLIFTINDEDTEYFYGKYYSMYDFDNVKYINNVKVPANYSWEIHDVTAVSEAFYSGKNGSTAKNVLTTDQVTDLMDEGLCRVCIYDNKGNVSDRYLAYFTSAPTYKITYVLNGGTNSTENPLHYTKNQEVVLKTPTYEYNTFLGWYSDENCTKKVTKIAKGSTGDKTFYAKWRPNQYSVIYYPNGPKGNPVTKTYPYNHNIVFPQNLFTYPGYKLGGWTENADGTGVMYELSCSIPALSKEDGAKFELYAKWDPAHYTIVLDKGSNAAEITDGTVEWYNNRFEVAYDDEFVLTGNEYIYPGHKLTGWKTDSGKKIANGEVSRLSAVDGGEVTLYAQWAVENYTITYDYDGGKVKKANPKTYTYETEATTLNVPTKKGYIFNGYYAINPETGMEEPIALIGGGMTGNLKIKAKYSPISYTVVLKDGTDEEGVRREFVYNREDVFGNAGYQKTGYTLSAWSTKPNGKGTKYKVDKPYKNLTAEHDKEVTLYACWTKDSYSITYNLDGGKNHKKNPKKYNVDSSITLKTPTKKGYTFIGWFDESVSANAIEKIEKGTLTVNLVLTAKWTPVEYDIVLDPNNTVYPGDGVEGPVHVGSFSYDTQITPDVKWGELIYPSEEYKNQGIGILYWSTKANGSGKKYYPDQTYSGLATEGTVKLYAQWGKIPFAINYVYAGVDATGIKNKNPKTFTYDVSAMITLKNVTKTGYVFKGWYTDPSFEEEYKVVDNKLSRNKIEDITLYAWLTPVSYTIKLNPNGSDVTAKDGLRTEFSVEYGAFYTLDADAYTKVHYKFDYWTTKPNGKGIKVTSGTVDKALSTTNGATVNLYPKWELTPYTITYHNVAFDGERVVNKNPNSYKYNSRKEVKLKNPTRTGYVFGGWYEEDTTAEGFDVATAEKITKITKGASGNMELYALWTPITFNVKFEANGKNVVLNEEQKDVENVTYGELLMVKPVYSRKGYNLVGFNTKKNGKGTMYATGMEHTIFASKANSTVKLYAIWEKVTNEKISSLELSSDSGSVTVWYAQNEDCNHYKVAISEFFTMTNARTVETGSDTVTFDGLESGKRYYVRVREIRFDSMGNPIEGPWSSLVSIKTTE